MKAVFAISAIAALGVAMYMLRPAGKDREVERVNTGTPNAEKSRAPVAIPYVAPTEHQPDVQRSALSERISRLPDENSKPIADLLSGEVIGVQRLRNVGSQTVSAAIESWLWAAAQFAESEASALTRAVPRQLERQREELILSAVRKASTMTSIRVQRHESYGPDRMLVWIEPDSSATSEVFLMTRTGAGGGWQRDLDPRAFK